MVVESPSSFSSSPESPRQALSQILSAVLKACPNGSDIFFSPGRPVQVGQGGGLVAVDVPGLTTLKPGDTSSIAGEILGGNAAAAAKLESDGACDVSYSAPSVARFRANIFSQRGSRAIVMRVIPSAVPELESLGLPPAIGDIARLSSGLVFVTGGAGCGKSTTLAALIDKINRERACHIITIEDPIEFLHAHKMSTVHQRELHSDTPSFALGLHAALRQSPHVIFIGEMPDLDTVVLALEAAETGHLVLSALQTADVSKTLERLVSLFAPGDQGAARLRLARSLRYIVSERLIPRPDGSGRVAAVEILRSTARTREYIEKGESAGKTLVAAMRDGSHYGMQDFDGEIGRLIRSSKIELHTGLSYASNPGNLELELSDLRDSPPPGSEFGVRTSAARN
jgi:twitching motility protein PilT